MSLETVVEDIRKRGKAEVGKLKKEGKTEAETILKQANSKREKIIEDAMKGAKKATDRLRTQELARAELENKRARLVIEKELLDLAYQKAREKIKTLPKDKDDSVMRALITKHSSDGAVIHTDAKHGTFVRSSCSLRFGDPIECLGGIVLESADGSVRFDYTYDTILEAAADACLKDIARILFQD